MDDSGAQLRNARREAGVGLDFVARMSGRSKGHLSRVERGERPVTPAIILAYERALGSRVPGAAAAVTYSRALPHQASRDEDEMQRRALIAGVIATATGAAAGSPLPQLISGWDTTTPSVVTAGDIAELERSAMQLTTRDLQGSGHAVIAEGRALLAWAVGMLDATRTITARRALASAAGYLADRTGWAAFDLGSHDEAVRFFGTGLRLAKDADNANLTAQILCDMAGHAVFRHKPGDSLAHSQLALRDRRVATPLRAALHAVAAEAYGHLGDVDQAHRSIDAARAIAETPVIEDHPVWLPVFRGASGLTASTGYAMYLLYQRTRAPGAAAEAFEQTRQAASTLGGRRSRSAVLCSLRAATVSLSSPDGDADTGMDLAAKTLTDLTHVRSVRIRRELTGLRAALLPRAQNPQTQALDAKLEELLAGPVSV